MIICYFLLALPPALGQFLPMDLAPDVAFGDDNERYDLTGVMDNANEQQIRNPARRRQLSAYDLLARRAYDLQPPEYRRHDLDYPAYRRDEGWLQGTEDMAEERLIPIPDSRDYRRRHHGRAARALNPPKIAKAVRTDDKTKKANPPDRELLLHFSVPIHVKMQDRENGTFITGIKLF